MKCPKCGAPPTNMVLTSNPVQYRCSQCDYVGTRGPWMAHAKQAHAERLQAARDEVEVAGSSVRNLELGWRGTERITQLIKAHIELALLERGGG